uniref:Uncharacterized protein n=2 Tax=Candidatus Kentrum sp. LPFa TaxID=2126335 RepID=A0A450X7B5_9GAMM|nr:MAG: hypothetical protein BECKLPF1236A_GA0070988_104571 [Candidatus Kentron sp. LPFa]
MMELNALYHCVASLDVHQAVVIVCIITFSSRSSLQMDQVLQGANFAC